MPPRSHTSIDPLLPQRRRTTPRFGSPPLMPCSSAAPPPPPPECRDAAADASPARGEHANPPPPAAAPMPAAHDGSKEARPSGVILDSGAAASATGSADCLSDLKAAPGGEAFRTRAGTHLPVAAVGTLTTASFRIADVRHVPGLRCTVVSVRQLTRQGLAVTFGAESCSVKDPATGAVVGEGRLQEEDGFYHLQYLRVPQS